MKRIVAFGSKQPLPKQYDYNANGKRNATGNDCWENYDSEKRW